MNPRYSAAKRYLKNLGGKIMSVKESVIETMKAAGKPLSAGEVEKLSG